MPRTIKVIGNPGTGKTKYLVDHTVSLIQSGVLAEEIAYLTFTRKAAQEAKDRLVALTGSDPGQFKYVRTLHSLAFQTRGISKEQMISDADMQALLSVAGVHDELEGKQIMQMHSFARIAGIKMMEAWERMQGTIPVQWTKLLVYNKVYAQFKEQMGLYDFYDLLETYLDDPVVPRLHTVIVDEAQDLSPIQWSIIKVLSEKAQVLMLAGDPHQSIYEWCGADSNILTSLPGEECILPKSNRIPQPVQAVSQRVLAKYADINRYPYEPASHPGRVQFLENLHYAALDLTKGSWMFLARNEVFLTTARGFLHQMAYPFESRGSAWTHRTDQKLLRHIEWYDQWLRTGDITPGKLEKLKKYCSRPEYCAAMNLPWQHAFDALPLKDRQFYAACRENENINIVLSTIHGSKGCEADNVVIFGDYTTAVENQFKVNPDQEYACLYVGVTRAKQNLILVQQERQLGYKWKEFV